MSGARRVMVSGATTPGGAALVRALLEEPSIELVLALGLEEAGSAAVATALPGAERRLVYEQVDLRRPRALRRLLFGRARALEISAVVHSALHRSARDGGRGVHDLNVESMREFLHLLERHPTISRLVVRSYAEVYRLVQDRPSIVDEEHPLDLRPEAPQWVRDRVEADLTACSAMGQGRLKVIVLRCAECLAPGSGSQLYDYLQSRVCMRPLGFDPMMNLLSIEDQCAAIVSALRYGGQGIFNIPGADTLPLSRLIARFGRVEVPVPAPLLGPLYRLRSATIGADFRYDLNYWRFHFSGVLDGARARERLGYSPQHPLRFPR
ncbi:MAG: hypothetical protein IPK80_18020 [Nannocystis sp.]|nr:hypothetical protein [Nannocystis sp.]